MKIRAAVLEEFGAPLTVQDLDLAEPKACEVLVRLVACGVCHTDLYTAPLPRAGLTSLVSRRPPPRQQRPGGMSKFTQRV